MAGVKQMMLHCSAEFSAQLRDDLKNFDKLRDVVTIAFEQEFLVLRTSLLNDGDRVRVLVLCVSDLCDMSAEFNTLVLRVLEYLHQSIEDEWGDVEYSIRAVRESEA